METRSLSRSKLRALQYSELEKVTYRMLLEVDLKEDQDFDLHVSRMAYSILDSMYSKGLSDSEISDSINVLVFISGFYPQNK